MTRSELQHHAKRIGITESALRKRIVKWGEVKALSIPKISKAGAGRRARQQSSYRFMLPGSHTFED
jgi:hypothetical protein